MKIRFSLKKKKKNKEKLESSELKYRVVREHSERAVKSVNCVIDRVDLSRLNVICLV